MTILSIIILAASAAAFCVLAHMHVCSIKRKFKIDVAAFDRLEKQFDAKCKAYNELVECVTNTPLPGKVFRYPICKKCVKAYLNDEHICNEIDCMPFDKINRDDMYEYEGFVPLKDVAVFYMANRLKPAVEKE